MDSTRHNRHINLQFSHMNKTKKKSDMRVKYNLSVQVVVTFFIPENYVLTVDLNTFYM